MALRCTVATPTRELFQGEIAYASIPGADGSYGVLPGHELFVGTNDKGILSLWLDSEGKERREFVIFKGASQVFNDRVSVLGSFGIALEEIDVAAVRAEAEELRQKAKITLVSATSLVEGGAHDVILKNQEAPGVIR